jgi:hypothetical protein
MSDGLEDHGATRGCIFDFTKEKRYRRISISNPNICSDCKKTMEKLEKIIKSKLPFGVSLNNSTQKLLSRKWLGNVKKENSPLYNLRRNYGYDMDINSGFYKKWWEIARDNIKQNSIVWLVTGVIGMVILLLGNFLQIILHLPGK